MTYVIRSEPQIVTSVLEKRRSVYLGGYGQDARFRMESDGWHVSLTGSPASLHVGDVQPALRTGDEVVVEIRRIDK